MVEVAAFFFVIAVFTVLIVVICDRLEDKELLRDERRLRAYAERRAAVNAHPHTGNVTVTPRTRGDHQ